MTKRNFGLPPGCTCENLTQAQHCYERCDDAGCEHVDPPPTLSPFWRYAITVGVVLGSVALLAAIAHGDTVKPIQLPPVVVEAPPRYCMVLSRFERSCTGVKLAAASLGRVHAETLARKCGATEMELAEARRCFDPAN